MLPAALGLGPGMVNGALNVKLLTPQSALPGFVASILPWMYCPLMWCIYNFGVQAMGSVWLLMGLILLAYAPMGLVAVGSIKEIAKPMTDEEALSAVNAMRLTVRFQSAHVILSHTMPSICCNECALSMHAA